MVLSNPRLAELLTARLGLGLDGRHRRDSGDSNHLLKMRNSARSGEALSGDNMAYSFAAYIHERLGIVADPDSMFDVLVKRLHEYKRQHLQVLAYYYSLLKRIQRDPNAWSLYAPHFCFRRQSCTGVPHGQADHQADPLCW